MTSLFAFFVLTYLVSWTLFTIALAASGGSAPGLATPAGMIFLAGVFGPAIAAVILAAWADGRAGVRALLRSIVDLRPGARWYVFAAGYMAAVKLTAALFHRILAGTWPPLGPESVIIMVLGLVVSTPIQAGEEIGWRGYALPRLAAYVGLGPASIILGVIWACWHLPIYFVPGAETASQSFAIYTVSVTAISVAMAWLYWRTNGSLLLTMLMHAAINNTKDIVPSAGPAVAGPFGISASRMSMLTAALLWVCAAYLLVRMRGATLPRELRSPPVVAAAV